MRVQKQSGLLAIQHPYELANELDHLTCFVASFWKERNGGFGTRDPSLQPTTVSVAVGLHRADLVVEPETDGDVHLVRTTVTPPAGALTVRETLKPEELGVGKRLPEYDAGEPTVEAFLMPDFLLVECARLQQLYRKVTGGKTPRQRKRHVNIGPIRRHKKLFPAVVARMKLQWLGRLHFALTSIGRPCTLVRHLDGILADTCAVHDYPHSALAHFDSIMEMLRTRLVQAWPLFLAFVATHDATASVKPSELSVDDLNELLDDIYVAWFAQEEPSQLPVEACLEELDFFKIRRPTVRCDLDSLWNWVVARPQTKYRYVKAAQVEAHHLALIFDMPPLWPGLKYSDDDFMEMATQVVANPKTFNAGVRRRVALGLEERIHRDARGAPVPSLSRTVDRDLMIRFKTHMSQPQDRGVLMPVTLQALRDKNPPQLVGSEARFSDVRKWHERQEKAKAKEIAESTAPSPRKAKQLPPLGAAEKSGAQTPRIEVDFKFSSTQHKAWAM